MPTKLQVIAKRPKFRRAGFEFSDTEPMLLDPNKLTKEETEALKSERYLVVSEVEVADAPKGKKAE